MRASRPISGVLISIAALCAASCSSSDSGNTAANTDGATCGTPIGNKCKGKDANGTAYVDMAVCHSHDEKQYWWLVCTNTACTAGKRIDCVGSDCSSVTSQAINVCQPNVH